MNSIVSPYQTKATVPRRTRVPKSGVIGIPTRSYIDRQNQYASTSDVRNSQTWFRNLSIVAVAALISWSGSRSYAGLFELVGSKELSTVVAIDDNAPSEASTARYTNISSQFDNAGKEYIRR